MLVGNKLDIVEKNESIRKVSVEEAQAFARKHSLEFQETSAVTDEGVDDAFLTLLQGIFFSFIFMFLFIRDFRDLYAEEWSES